MNPEPDQARQPGLRAQHTLHHRFWPDGLPLTLPKADRSMWRYMADFAAQQPDKTAIVFYDSVTTYGQLVLQTEALAGWLQQAGVAAGDRVLVMSQNCPQFIAAYYGVLRADAVVVPVNAMCTADEVAHHVRDSGARVAFVAQELLASVLPLLQSGALTQVVAHAYADALTEPTELAIPAFAKAPREPLPAAPAGRSLLAWPEVMARRCVPAPHRAGPDDLAVLPYTSGTTGRPKGCRHTHATVQASNIGSAAWRGLGPHSTFLAVAPMFHMLGMQNGMNLPLTHGGSIVLLPRWDRQSAALLIERYKVTTWAAPPAMLVDFFANPELPGRDLSSLTLLFGGGAAMPDAVTVLLKEKFGITYYEGYGMSETASFLHSSPRPRPKRECLGVPAFGVDSRIIDPQTLQELPQGEVGEIVTNGPQVMLGYWNNPQADRDSFIELDGKRFLRTGDLAYIDEDGYFFMKDRLKRMVNVSGYKVWPAEVESMLYEHPAVHEACVVAVKDGQKGELVKALVVLRPDFIGQVSAQDLIDWARQRMAVYKSPRLVDLVDHLPKSNTGKILWRELQEREQQAAAPS